MRTAFARASLEVTGFSNRYDDFIEFTARGFNPRTRLLEFQAQNLEQATITGVELRGEAHLTDRVMLRGSYARIDGVEILKDAAVPARAEETPLGSIAPNEGVLGIRYVQPSGRWGTELSLRLVESYQGAPTTTSSRRTPTRSSISWALSRSPKTSPFALAYST